jgi:hypothetical protein
MVALKLKSGEDNMPGMTERRRKMRGETKTARGDYDKKGYGHGGDVKYMGGGGHYNKKGRSMSDKDKGKYGRTMSDKDKGKYGRTMSDKDRK